MIGIIGAGLSGLAAGYVLIKENVPVRVFEKEPVIGGLARTVRFGDYLFDLGGHRFYTKIAEVQEFVEELLGQDLLRVERSSSIFLRGKLISYPLRPYNAVMSLGLKDSVHAGFDYLLERSKRFFRRPPSERSFEEWAIRRFGRRLYEIYFKTYSEKVWGIPCSELSADFAEQRIRGLSFAEALKNALFRRKVRTPTLVRQFYYPRRGFGMIPEALASQLPPGSISACSEVTRVYHKERRITALETTGDDGPKRIHISQAISTIPVSRLAAMLEPPPPGEVLESASRLRYRDLIVVFLGVKRPRVTKDQWRYFPSMDIPFSRIHEPKNWSEEMAPAEKSSLVIEYFANRGDKFWEMQDEELIELSVRTLERLGTLTENEVDCNLVLRLAYAYPLYAIGYRRDAQKVLDYLSHFSNLHCIGRLGRFLYTSSDHYILMGIKSALKVVGEDYDISRIGTEQKYAEE